MYSLKPFTLVSGCSIKCKGAFKIKIILFEDFLGYSFLSKNKEILTVHYVRSTCLRDLCTPGKQEV